MATVYANYERAIAQAAVSPILGLLLDWLPFCESESFLVQYVAFPYLFVNTTVPKIATWLPFMHKTLVWKRHIHAARTTPFAHAKSAIVSTLRPQLEDLRLAYIDSIINNTQKRHEGKSLLRLFLNF